MDDERNRVFEVAAELFGLLSAPTRLRIVHLLGDGELGAGELSAGTGAAPSNLSQHLGTLYRSGLLERRRVGARVLYRVAPQRLSALTDWLNLQRLGLAPTAADAAADTADDPAADAAPGHPPGAPDPT